MEYEKKHSTGSSGVSKAALALGITGTGLAVLSNAGGGLLNGLIGSRYAPGAVAAPPVQVAVEQAIAYGGFVSEKEMRYVRENTDLLAENARLRSVNYTNDALKIATDPIITRLCALEAQLQVNAARDADFRRFADREYVHQPMAWMSDRIVTTSGDDCCCGRHEHGHAA